MRRLILLLLPLFGCQTVTTQNANNLDRPEEMSIVCTTSSNCTLPLADVIPCDSDEVSRQCGFITNGARADLAVADLSTGLVLDNDRSIPGYTRIPLPGQPGFMVQSVADDALYITLQPDAENGGGIFRKVLGSNTDDEAFQELGEQAGPVALNPKTASELWVSLARTGQIAIVPLEEFGSLDPTALEVIPVSGSPGVLRFTSDGRLLIVGYENLGHITAIDVETRAILWNAPIAPDCMDGFDNDGDGLVDGLDSHCTDGDLWSERPAFFLAACADGVDQDGDGFIDYPEDPGCHSSADSTEDSDLSPCEDGLDGDGDGLIDSEDPDCAIGNGNREFHGCSDQQDNDGDGLIDTEDTEHCRGNDDPYETAVPSPCEDLVDNDGDGLKDEDDPDCNSSRFRGEVSTACGNQIDDDGDGLVDAEDPECLSRNGTSEAPKMQGVFSRIAISESNEFAYVTNRAMGQIFVIDLARGSMVDVHNRPPGLGQPLLAAEGIRGIPLPAAPIDIAFTETDVSLDGELARAETALVTTVDGQLYVLDAIVDGEPVHLLRPFSFGQSTAQTPGLSIAGNPIEQTFSVRSDYANLGAFGTSPEESIYHGVTLQGTPLAERTETWSLTHQGEIPDSTSKTASIIEVSDDELSITVQDPAVNYCALGVKPGDYFSFHFPRRLSCFGALGGAEFEGDKFEYPIIAVEQDRLILSRENGVAVMTWTSEEQPFLNSVGITDRPTFSTQAPTGEVTCLAGATATSIRVPRGVYTVTGTLSGFQHGQDAINGVCSTETSGNGIPARAFESVPKDELSLEECPFPLPDDTFISEFPFRNDAFSLTIRPGCESIEVTEEPTEENPEPVTTLAYQLAETPRDLTLSFSIISGYQPRRLLIAHIPERIVTTPGVESIFIVDSGLNRVVQLNPTTFLQGIVID